MDVVQPLEKPAWCREERLTWDTGPLQKRVHGMQKQEDGAKEASDEGHPTFFLVCFLSFLFEGEEKVILRPQSNMAQAT